MRTLILSALLATQAGCFGLLSSTSDDPAPPPPSPTASGHWQSNGTFSALSVLGHRFHAAELHNGYASSGDLCVIYATVRFDAPYADHYRFRAKLITDNGSWIKSPEFYNVLAGARSFTFRFDTGPDGCWGANRHYVHKLDVSACRGASCVPDPLVGDAPLPRTY